jgi:hypothetical protein
MKISIFVFIYLLISLSIIYSVPIHPQKRDIKWNGNDWAYDCDFDGNDLTSSVQIRRRDCFERCVEKSGCTHFTWIQWISGFCWMKYGSVLKSEVYSTIESETICGVISNQSSPS